MLEGWGLLLCIADYPECPSFLLQFLQGSPGVFALEFIPYLPLLCSALYLWTLSPVDLLASSFCCWLPVEFPTWGTNKRLESRNKGEVGSVHNSGNGCISPVIPLPTKQASQGPASIHPLILASGLTLRPSHSLLLNILPVPAFFYLDFLAVPSTA